MPRRRSSRRKRDPTVRKIRNGNNFLNVSLSTYKFPPYVRADYIPSSFEGLLNRGGAVALAPAAAQNGYATLTTLFDPTGDSTTAVRVNGVLGHPIAMAQPANVICPGWSDYAVLYRYYKVNRITLSFTASYMNDAAGTNELSTYVPYIYIRTYYRYDANISTLLPTQEDVSKENGWVQKEFTRDSPHFTFSFKPMVQEVIESDAVYENRCPRRMRWTPVPRVGVPPISYSPAQLYGIQMMCFNPNTNVTIKIDFKYNISFKDRT